MLIELLQRDPRRLRSIERRDSPSRRTSPEETSTPAAEDLWRRGRSTLAGAALADEADDLARLDRQAHIGDERLLVRPVRS